MHSTPDKGDGQRCQRAEFGADDHCADDRDRRVGDHAHRGDHARDAQEREIRGGEGGFLASARDELVPDHRVGRLSLGLVLGSVRPRRQHGVEGLQRDGPALLEAERLEVVDDVVGGLPGDVGGDRVAFRFPRGVTVHDQVRHPRIAAEDVDDRIAQVGGRDHA
jgi:hypothetical protein